MGLLDDIPTTQDAMTAALALQRRAAQMGLDWQHAHEVLQKIEEELTEVRDEMQQHEKECHLERLEAEIGDLLFAVINLARHVGADPKQALMSTNARFKQRFGYIEARLQAQGLSMDTQTFETLESLWQEAKRKLKTPG